ncbi:MAG: 4-hydroxy-3-methylbut-2-enyl diphosphate reductase [Fibrobacteria bacterium]|nr:4-hydroxy-3-methylbut-2-enyl diphosphate reductase [Fibrobacteria bacterium]
MKIYLAKTSGFCEGVQRALTRTIEVISSKKEGDAVYTYGPLIHNPQTLDMLKRQGVNILTNSDPGPDSEIIIRTHGVSPDEYKKLKAGCTRLINATCSKVARVQGIIKKFVKQGGRVFIIGDRDHAEVKGLLGFSRGQGLVLGNLAEAQQVTDGNNALIVVQTTFEEKDFNTIVYYMQSTFKGIRVHNTICSSTHDRQAEVIKLCKMVDVMIVTGGKESANTGRLASICRDNGVTAFHVEHPEEIRDINLSGCDIIGVTAGASTPRWIINQALEEIEQLDRRSFRGVIRRLSKFTVYSYLSLSIAAAALSYIFTTFMETTRDFRFAAIAFLYVYALGNINVNIFGLESGETADNEKELNQFYRAHKWWLLLSTCFALIGALAISYRLNVFSFILVAASIFLGTLFNVKLFSGMLARKTGFASLREIPGSKDIFIPLALSTVIVLVPAFSGFHGGGVSLVIISFFITALLIFLRSTLLHLIDIEEDRIVGRDTIPTVLGERKTVKVITVTVLGFIAALFLISVAGIGWPGSFLFSFNALAVLVLIRLFRERLIMRYYLFALALDMNLIFSFVVAYFGKMVIS